MTLIVGAAALLLSGLAAAFILRAASKAGGGDVAAARARHADDLAAIAADEETGVLTAEDAERLRTAAARRLLDAAPETPDRAGGRAVALAVGAVGIAAVGVYALTGSPSAPDAPYDVRVRIAEEAVAAGEAMALPLTERLVLLKSKAEAAPDDPQPWTRLGRAYLSFGQAPAAADAFLRAIEAGGETSERLSDLAASLLYQEDDPTAERRAADLLARALELDDNNVAALELAGFLAVRRGELQQAETALSIAIDIAPDGPRAPALRQALEAVRARMADAGAAERP
ncbi:MAG: c-type cytochrome biogenesis protein CcmI [Pseudomonadota bacterium]